MRKPRFRVRFSARVTFLPADLYFFASTSSLAPFARRSGYQTIGTSRNIWKRMLSRRRRSPSTRIAVGGPTVGLDLSPIPQRQAIRTAALGKRRFCIRSITYSFWWPGKATAGIPMASGVCEKNPFYTCPEFGIRIVCRLLGVLPCFSKVRVSLKKDRAAKFHPPRKPSRRLSRRRGEGSQESEALSIRLFYSRQFRVGRWSQPQYLGVHFRPSTGNIFAEISPTDSRKATNASRVSQ